MYQIQELVKYYLFLFAFYEHIHLGSNQSLTLKAPTPQNGQIHSNNT